MAVPIAERIDGFSNRTIIYRCGNCNASLAILGDKNKYCFNCGEKVQWNNVLVTLSTKAVDLGITSDELEEDFIKELNKQQRGME